MLDAARLVPAAGDHLLVYAWGTGMVATRGSQAITLSAGDCLLAEAGSDIRLDPRPGGETYLVDLWIDRR
jgi:hypothetical protein